MAPNSDPPLCGGIPGGVHLDSAPPEFEENASVAYDEDHQWYHGGAGNVVHAGVVLMVDDLLHALVQVRGDLPCLKQPDLGYINSICLSSTVIYERLYGKLQRAM